VVLQVGNSRYYDYVLSVNGKAEKHGFDYEKDYLTKLIVSAFVCACVFHYLMHVRSVQRACVCVLSS